MGMGIQKIMHGKNRSPSNDCGWDAITCMCSNVRQGDDDEPFWNQINPVSEPISSTKDNVGALKSTTGFIGPVKGKETNNQ